MRRVFDFCSDPVTKGEVDGNEDDVASDEHPLAEHEVSKGTVCTFAAAFRTPLS
jgi:hypothetical protein